MGQYAKQLKNKLLKIIRQMADDPSQWVRNPDKDFIRKRKLDFKKMMHLIISLESGSLNHELLKFFEYDSAVPTNSAFYQQRSKLSVSAFRHLLKEFNLKFPLEKFRGKYYLIACDGSELTLPEILTIQTPSTGLMANLYPVLIWFIPSLYMRYVLSGILI